MKTDPIIAVYHNAWLKKQISMGEKQAVMTERKYLPTFGDLVDRLSITLLKAIRIPEQHDAYMNELRLIEHDIDLLSYNTHMPTAKDIRMFMLLMLANTVIWDNESKARAGGHEQDHLLRMTHSVNGCRNMAKNWFADWFGERKDLKIDCLAADLPGDWRVFE